MNRKFRAFDSDSGKILWESTLGSSIMNSTITYAVNGRQYIAVFTGEGQNWNIGRELVPQLKVPRMFNSVNVFSLP
jgi:alcohol dehydrogenase (cytochrome c)